MCWSEFQHLGKLAVLCIPVDRDRLEAACGDDGAARVELFGLLGPQPAQLVRLLAG